MMKLTKKDMKIVKKGKEYFKSIRFVNREIKYLKEEYKELSYIKSVNFSELPSECNTPKDKQMNSLIIRQDTILSKINVYSKIVDEFITLTFFLETKPRRVIQTYINSIGYTDMINKLDEKYQYSENTYNRLIPRICLELSKYIDYSNMISIDNLNKDISIGTETVLKNQ